jgi:hypothetical protein
MKDAGFRVRVEKELRQEFVAACRLQGKVAAEVLRSFMRAYVTREGGGLQAGLFEQTESMGRGQAEGKRRGGKKWMMRR